MVEFKAPQSLLKDPNVKRWYNTLRADSTITAEAHLRRLNHLVHWMKLQPKQMVEKYQAERAAGDFIVDLATKFKARGMPTVNIYSHVEALGSWFEHNAIMTCQHAIVAPHDILGDRPELTRVLVVRGVKDGKDRKRKPQNEAK
jgi:hypothetical protein